MLDLQRRNRLVRSGLWRGLPRLPGAAWLPPSWASPLASFFGPGPLVPGDSPRHVRERLGRSTDELLAALEASTPQQQRVARALDGTAPVLYALVEQECEVRDQLKHALFASEVDHAAVERAQSELADIATRGSELVVAFLVELTATLTKTQRAALATAEL